MQHCLQHIHTEQPSDGKHQSQLAGRSSQAGLTKLVRALKSDVTRINPLAVGLDMTVAARERVRELELRQFYATATFIAILRNAVPIASHCSGGPPDAHLPPNLHPAIDELENICEEKRELDQQNTMHKALHGWLLIRHVPLSYAVLLLGALHAVM